MNMLIHEFFENPYTLDYSLISSTNFTKKIINSTINHMLEEEEK